MSMNLYWIAPNGKQEEFPYQTRTDLSYAVMKSKNTDEILKLFEEDLKGRSACYRVAYLTEIKTLLKKGYKFGIS